MRILLIFLIGIVPVLSSANFCKSNNGLLKKWRNQKNWVEGVINPSQENPALSFGTFGDNEGKVYLKNFEVNSTYKSALDMNIQSKYSREKYLEMCRDTYKKGVYLTVARRSANNSNTFRLKVDYLPSVEGMLNNPYDDQSLKTEKDGLGVRIILKTKSMVKRNAKFLESVSETVDSMEREINDSLISQVKQGIRGSLVINLDRKDDLVCDLMKGEAQLEFFHFSKMKSPLVDIVKIVDDRDVKKLYREIKAEVSGFYNAAKNFYYAGQVFEKLNQNNQIGIENKEQSFDIVSQFFQPNMVSIKNINESQLTCLAENESEFENYSYENSIILNVMTPQVQEMMEE